MSDPVSITPEQQHLLKQARIAGLLKIFASVSRTLTNSENEELRGVIPDALLRRAHAKATLYDHGHDYYETVYAVTSRTLKRWIKAGRESDPPERPPLDEPRRMKDWYQRRMKQRVPDHLVALAAATGQTLPVDPPAAAPASPPADPPPAAASAAPAAAPTSAPPPAPPASPIPVTGEGYLGALARRRQAEAAAGELYNTLVRQAARADLAPDLRSRLLAEAEQARRSWDDLSESLRKYELTAEAVLTASGRTWLSDDVVASLRTIHSALHEGMHGLIRRIRPKLKACATDTEADQLWEGEIERLFSALRANRFMAPPGQPAAAA